MTAQMTDAWHPRQEDILGANVTALMNRLKVGSYDELYAFSIARPDAYWREVIDFCGIVWSRDYTDYIDVSRSEAFPKWFIGGELNWVDTILARAADPVQADRTAIIGEREDGSSASVTFGELASKVQAFAAGLAALGIRRGDRVGLLMENGIEASVSFMALAYSGAIVVPLFSGFGVDAIVSRLSACDARTLIATSGFARRGKRVDMRATVADVRRQLPGLELVICKKGPDEEAGQHGFTDWGQVLSGAGPAAPSARMSPNDPFMIIYTSGTTGKPKGAVHTHGGFPLKICHDAAIHFNIKPGDVVCWPADMGWIAGALVMCSALLRGATLVCYDGAPDFPDWSRMSRLIERYRITHYGSAPTLIRGLASNAALAMAGDTSSVRLLITAGEGIDPEHFCWFQKNFGRGVSPVINYTGGTEVSGGLLSSVIVKPISPSLFNTRSPGISVDVVDQDGTPVRNRAGELAVLKPFVGMTQSFWQDDERYLDTYWHTVPGIWIHGDLALHTDSDEFHLLGRSDDTIKLAGKRLGPAEVEEVLLELPEVGEAAAVGVSDPVKGQKLVVFIIPSSSWRGDPQQLAAAVASHVGTRLGKPFAPGKVHIVRQLPKTRSSKIMRRLIRAVYTDQPLGDLTALDNPPALDEIRAAAAS
jgi:acetyl-CoA synthetase